MTTPGFQVVFPAPPPTINDLTPQQRIQLVRKTRKIEQILGTAPRLIEASIRPIHISFPDSLPQQRTANERQSSFDSMSSGSSTGSLSPIQRSFSLSSTIHPINSKTGSNGCCSMIHGSAELSQNSTFDKTAPLLRLAMGSATLETIPASPPPTGGSFSVPSPPTSNEDQVFALTAQDGPSPRTSLVLTEKAPSLNSLRKQKMDRIRKRLGSDVPFDLVFPIAKSSDRTENIPPRNAPPLRIPKKRTAKITTSKESISDAASIHRARRQARATAFGKYQQHETSTLHSATPPRPSTADSKKFTSRLSSIVESPDEHRFTAFPELDLAFPRRMSSRPTKESDVIPPGWTGQSHDAEFSLWSTITRSRDCESEASSTPSLSPVSSTSSESDSNTTEPPVTPASSVAPDTLPSPFPTVMKTITSTGEVKKRPASYRKPPPPVPVDCC